MPSAEENKKIVANYFEALNKMDLDRLFAMFDDDLDYWVPGDWQMAGHHSKKAFRQMMNEFNAGPPLDEPLYLTPKGWTAEGNRVAVEVTSHAKNKGKTYANTYHILFVIDDNGKIKNLHEYLDTKKAIDFFFG